MITDRIYIARKVQNVKLTSITKKLSDEFSSNATPLPHLTLPAVGQIGDHSNYLARRAGFARVYHDQELHYRVVYVLTTSRADYKHLLTSYKLVYLIKLS